MGLVFLMLRQNFVLLLLRRVLLSAEVQLGLGLQNEAIEVASIFPKPSCGLNRSCAPALVLAQTQKRKRPGLH
jgi:hypothetical protein